MRYLGYIKTKVEKTGCETIITCHACRQKEVKMMKNIAQALLNEADAESCIELGIVGFMGVFIQSQESIMTESWYNDDESRGQFDATNCNYWMITDSGDGPYCYDTAEDLADFLEDYRSNLGENFMPIFSIGVVAKQSRNIYDRARSDYAVYIAAEVNKLAKDLGYYSDYDWFKATLAAYSESIGFEMLFIRLEAIFEIEGEE